MSENKGDLISREALKKAFALLMWKEHNPYDAVKVCDIVNQTLDFIDNAPTVPLPDFKEGYKQAIIDGKTNFSRPQGEWQVNDNLGECIYYTCSNCGEISCCKGNFCPDCGADMRGANNG